MRASSGPLVESKPAVRGRAPRAAAVREGRPPHLAVRALRWPQRRRARHVVAITLSQFGQIAVLAAGLASPAAPTTNDPADIPVCWSSGGLRPGRRLAQRPAGPVAAAAVAGGQPAHRHHHRRAPATTTALPSRCCAATWRAQSSWLPLLAIVAVTLSPLALSAPRHPRAAVGVVDLLHRAAAGDGFDREVGDRGPLPAHGADRAGWRWPPRAGERGGDLRPGQGACWRTLRRCCSSARMRS